MELAETLGEPVSSLHRTLQTLIGYELVVQEPQTRRYRLGPGILALADAYREQSPLVIIAQPVLDDLRTVLNESVFLCELVDERAVVVAVAESPRPLRTFMRLGHHMPFHAAASARAILAFQDPARIRRLLQIEKTSPYTSRTKVDDAATLTELDRAHRRGYATCDQEMEVGVKAIAMPIRDSTGCVVASVAVVAPRERLTGRARVLALQALTVAATDVSGGLGWHSHAERSLSTAPQARR
jgi:DNA-binding IclR family transcriptional regulator